MEEINESDYMFWKRYEKNFVFDTPISAETIQGLRSLETSLVPFIKSINWKPKKESNRGSFGIITEERVNK